MYLHVYESMLNKKEPTSYSIVIKHMQSEINVRPKYVYHCYEISHLRNDF